MSMIEDILDLAKIDSGNFSINESEFSLIELLKEIEYIFGYQCEQKKINFDICIKTPSQRVISDPKRLKQVLLNLISNSLKFTTSGSITLEIEQERNNLIFKVVDTGIGIKEENQDKLFKLFGTINEENNIRNQHGCGLGLTVCKRIVEALSGEITLISQYKIGTQIHFSIK
jgi:two-component system autoinducer 2 sensor kinase/phosphatase LuxQ